MARFRSWKAGFASGELRQSMTVASAAALVMLLVFLCGLALAAEDETNEPIGSAALSAAPVPPDGSELVAKRTATSETYLLPGGSRETRIYEAPIHFKDAEGVWRPIEEGLERVDGAIENGDNSSTFTCRRASTRVPCGSRGHGSLSLRRSIGCSRLD